MHKILNILVIFALLIPSGLVGASNTTPNTIQPSQEGIFRTWVKVADEQDLKRIEALGVVILATEAGKAQVLAGPDALEQLAKLGFQPDSTEDLTSALGTNSLAEVDTKDVVDLAAIDDDDDGLTNTQESWWCMDPLDADSDDDAITDGNEIQILKDWLTNRRSSPPMDSPWASWPFNTTTCPDKDYDSLPNLAERYELGLSMDLESTDRDKFDDGQELFGVTYCPGGDLSCGYGALPRTSDSGFIGQDMPSWVQAPGNHPLVTAHPMPEIDVVPSSLKVETVTVVTTDHVISSGTEQSYSTSETKGTGTSISNSTTWNDWEEASDTTPLVKAPVTNTTTVSASYLNYQSQTMIIQQPRSGLGVFGLVDGLVSLAEAPGKLWNAGRQIGEGINEAIFLGAAYGAPWNWNGHLDEYDEMQAREQLSKCLNGETCRDPATGVLLLDGGPYALQQQSAGAYDQNFPSGLASRQMRFDEFGSFIQPGYPINVSVSVPPTPTHTETRGHSWGGSQTNTSEQYEEHTITNGEAFSSEESWGTAVAADSAHAADLWFSYQVSNTGSDLAREICNLTFNVYLDDDPNPIYTYYVPVDWAGNCFENLEPGESHIFSSRTNTHAIPLSLEQLKQIDLDGTLRIEVEDFTFGSDEYYYLDALARNLQLAVEDGVEDGDEAIDHYLIPTYAGDTVIDVLGRYFPYAVDEDGELIAFWTPEYREDVPAWCAEPQVVGAGASQTVWCKHALTTADWWNIYTDNLGDGSLPLQETPAVGGSTALIRFNADSDLDGYSDRSEERLGTDPYNAADFPQPELLAGLHSSRSGTDVVSTLSLLNTGLYDAYGVEAVMIAPDDSITITNNTVGGSGRVRSGKQVVVGSRILSPTLATWTGTARPTTGGYYTGTADRTYTFSVSCANPAGCPVGGETWTLNWSDGTNSGALNFGSGYLSPNLVSVGGFGLKLGMLSGKVFNGNSFRVTAITPRDTFQYTINREPYTEPVVIVSYNDPQGNHRFVLPATALALTTPAEDLLPLSGQMLDLRGVEIVTSAEFNSGANSTSLVVDNPTTKTLQDAKLFLEFIDPQGAVVAEVTASQNVLQGPNVIEIGWDTADFNPAYDPAQDYIVMAFWTDYEGNILDVLGRPLSSFQADPQSHFAMSESDAAWEIGSIPQGSLLKRSFTFANTGERGLLTYVEAPVGLSVSQVGSREVGVADQTTYEITLNTEGMAIGALEKTITIRTSDPAQAVRTVLVTGTITEGTPDTGVGSLQRPLDYLLTVPAPQTQGTWYSFTQPIGPDPQTIHPVKVFSGDYSQLWGVGKYASSFSTGTTSYEMFGDGRDGDLVVNSGETIYLNNIRTNVTAAGSTATVVNSSGFFVGDIVIFHQTQGTVNTGKWELSSISHIDGLNWILSKPLSYSYSNLNGKAQVVKVPQYRNITVNTGGNLTTSAWDGMTGGIFVIKVNGSIEVYGTIDISSKGYRGFEKWPSPGETGYQGENINPGVIQSISAINNGGGGGQGYGDGGAGGGGGSHATAGTFGLPRPSGGPLNGYPALMIVGSEDLNLSFSFGGAGGAGGSDDSAGSWDPYPCGMGGKGGNGGGVGVIYGRLINISGTLLSNGQNGATGGYLCSGGAGGGGGGAGGAGGSILIKGGTISVATNKVLAQGGIGGAGVADAGSGGSGGQGRIRIEYCESLTGSTNPAASVQKLNCYIAEQSEVSPYTTTRLNLPETITSNTNYALQFGRRFLFSASSALTNALRLPASLLTSATVDALISGVGTGTLTLSLDIGNDGSTDYTYTGTVSDSMALDDLNLTQAFNRWWANNGRPTIGEMDVPVKVSLSKAGQVLLSDLQVMQTGSSLRTLRLEDGTYSSVLLDYTLTGASGPLTVGLDVGDDGTIDDVFSSESPTNPQAVTSGNLAAAVNGYLDAHPGDEVDIPLRFHLPSGISLRLTDFHAVLSGTLDFSLSAADIGVPASSPTEGAEIPVSATLHNNGSLASGGVVAAFFANAPGWGEWYIGSSLVGSIPAGGTALAQINWDTLGFNGSIPLTVRLDPYLRVSEGNEDNNTATTNYTILTRPDLVFAEMELSDPEPVDGQTVQVSLPVHNTGQTNAGSTPVRLYLGNPAEGGSLIGEAVQAVSAGGVATSVVDWTPAAPGTYRLFAVVDEENLVNESLEGNNLTWKDLHVGFAGPLIQNSGTLAEDPAYSSLTGYGFVDSGLADVLGTCGTSGAWENSFRRDPEGQVWYQFDHLQPGHFYHLDIVLYECDGAGRQESLFVDGMNLAGPVDLGDGEVHRLSLRLDPALYSDHQISVLISAPGADGAVVSAVNLHDIDYRYADSGGVNDPQYPGSRAFGWLDGAATTSYGTLPYQSGRVDQNDNVVRYQFDNLAADKEYDLDLTFWQSFGTGRIQKIRIDGVDSGITIDTSDYLVHRERIPVPANLYQTDGSVVVSIERTNASTGAMINEIALEQRTIFTGQPLTCDHVKPTPYFTDNYGYLSYFAMPGQIGQRVEALNPRAEVVGCYIVDVEGQYGFMRIFGEDISTNPITPGMRSGEKVTYRVSGFPAYANPELSFQDDHAIHQVDLEVRLQTEQTILMNTGWNLISFNVESPAPLISFMLGGLSSRVDRLLGEYGVYSPTLPGQFLTLKELHAGEGYYALVNGTTSVNWVSAGEPIPDDYVFNLHAGWNWIGGIKENMPVETALFSIIGKFRRVINLTKSYDTTVPPTFNTLKELIPGEGYLIFMTEAAQLVYPYTSKAEEPPLETSAMPACTGLSPSPRLTIVYGNVTLNGENAPAGSRVEFLTERDELAGCVILSEAGQLPLTHIYGTEEGVAGFETGEILLVRINGLPASLALPLTWEDDRDIHEIQVISSTLKIFLPLITH